MLAFLRITTNPRVYQNPFSLLDAISIVNDWITHPSVEIIQPGKRHWFILSKLLPNAQAKGPLVMDAHLAALAIEHGATLYSTDKDFTRFSGLKLINPLDGTL